jgi:predicted MFS family arabinose efflux permease
MVFLNDYLQSQGLTKPAATAVVMTFGAGGAAGSLIAGIAGRRLYLWRKGSLPVATGVTVWLGAPALFVLVNSAAVQRWPLPPLLAFMFAAGTMASVAGVIIRPLVMNVNVPEARGVALALQARCPC